MAIYFIEEVGSDLLKIGFTDRDPMDRLRELQTANGHKLELRLVQAGDINREAQLHKVFAHLNTVGEWFRLTPELQTFLWAARFVMPRMNELEDRVEKLRAREMALSNMIAELEVIVERLVEKVEPFGHPDAPPAWQGEIDDLRNLVNARIR